tara:strand:- start:231 stop:1022 length:792 start_codon:yes stop_codon:yes gene_type:complete
MPGEWRKDAKEYQNSDDFKKRKNVKYKKPNKRNQNNNQNNNQNKNQNYYQNENQYKYQYQNQYQNKILEPINQNKIIVPINPNSIDIELKFDYLEKCKKVKEEEEKKGLNLKDPKYWNKNKWIGPKFMKQNKSKLQVNSITIFPNNVLYSRNGVDWFTSWKGTFQEEEYNKMIKQINEENEERLLNIYREKMERKDRERKKESIRHYNETGELDDYAKVEIMFKRHLEYEDSLQKEIDEYEEQEDSDNYDDDDIESDNNSLNN